MTTDLPSPHGAGRRRGGVATRGRARPPRRASSATCPEASTRRRRWAGLAVTTAMSVAVLASPAVARAADLAGRPTLTVTPDAGLADGQQVDVSGDGFDGGSLVSLVQCAAAPEGNQACDLGTEDPAVVGDDGSITRTYPVAAVIETVRGDRVDCRRRGACELAAIQDDTERALAALVFEADATLLPPPVITVRPDRGLVDGQVVEITGEGLRPGRPIFLAQCAPGPESLDACRFGGSEEVAGDAEGHLSARFTVLAEITDGDRRIDCRATPEPCLIVASVDGRTGPRTPRADLHFDADAPLLPSPRLSVEPSTDLRDGGTVRVEGTGFAPDGFATVTLCQAGADHVGALCDGEGGEDFEPDDDGRFRGQLSLDGDLTVFDGEAVEGAPAERTVDCRRAPGCELVATDWARDRRVRVPVSFAPLPPPRPFLDPIFDEVEVTRDVLYRTTTDVDGNPIELRLDIWQPVGDRAASRPAVLWMHGGYFVFGDRRDMDSYARDFARRGYVAVSLQYRLREDMPISDVAGIVEASYDAYEDALAAVDWLESRAGQYRIDTGRIAAGGYSAGAITALNLAYLPNQRGPATSPIDAAVSIAGLTFGRPESGEPPSLALHGTRDDIVPFDAAEQSCRSVVDAGLRCELVPYEGSGHEIVSTRRRDIVRRTAEFLRTSMILRPDPAPPQGPAPSPPTSPGPPPSPSTPVGTARPAIPRPASANFTG